MPDFDSVAVNQLALKLQAMGFSCIAPCGLTNFTLRTLTSKQAIKKKGTGLSE